MQLRIIDEALSHIGADSIIVELYTISKVGISEPLLCSVRWVFVSVYESEIDAVFQRDVFRERVIF